MYPEVFSLGFLTIHSYGVALGCAFVVMLSVNIYLGRRLNIDPELIKDTALWIVVGALIGSRLFYVFLDLDHFMANPIDIFKVWAGGLVFYGGFVGGFLALSIMLYIHRSKVDFWDYLDTIAPAMSLGHMVGRLGCFMAGCCYGKPTDTIFGVTFLDPKSFAPLNIPIHPTQLYDSFNELAIFTILILLWRNRKFKGQIALTYMILYPIGRSIVEIFRGDAIRGVWLNSTLSFSQIISGIILLVALSLLYRNYKTYPLAEVK
ncbi:MAG: prolipoprotein diacylglyceryl transferase [Nitrospinota bacterium]